MTESAHEHFELCISAVNVAILIFCFNNKSTFCRSAVEYTLLIGSFNNKSTFCGSDTAPSAQSANVQLGSSYSASSGFEILVD